MPTAKIDVDHHKTVDFQASLADILCFSKVTGPVLTNVSQIEESFFPQVPLKHRREKKIQLQADSEKKIKASSICQHYCPDVFKCKKETEKPQHKKNINYMPPSL